MSEPFSNSGSLRLRPVRTSEADAIRRVAAMLPAPRGQRLLEDLEQAAVDVQNSSPGRIVFVIAGYDRPQRSGQRSLGVEGKLVDRDGTELAFDLFADENDRLMELELIRWRYLAQSGFAILGGELWMVIDKRIYPVIPTVDGTFTVWTWSCDPQPNEPWLNYVARSADAAREATRDFSPYGIRHPPEADFYFNLTWASEAWIREMSERKRTRRSRTPQP